MPLSRRRVTDAERLNGDIALLSRMGYELALCKTRLARQAETEIVGR